jgi:hypothetical protein
MQHKTRGRILIPSRSLALSRSQSVCRSVQPLRYPVAVERDEMLLAESNRAKLTNAHG